MNGYLIIGVLVLISIGVLFFSFKMYEKKKEQIEQIVQKLKPKTKNKFNFNLGTLLGIIIVIIVGVNLIPTVVDQITEVKEKEVTGVAGKVLGLTTVFFALGIVAAGISFSRYKFSSRRF